MSQFSTGVIASTTNVLTQKVLPWLRSSRRRVILALAAAVLVGLIIVIAASGSGGPEPTDANGSAVAQVPQPQAGSVSSPASQPTSRPTSQPANQLYDPNAEGADETWSMPEKLSTAEVRGRVAQLDKLQKEVVRLSARIQGEHDDMASIAADDVRQALWRQLVDRGFRDPKVPELFHAVMKDNTGILDVAGRELSLMTIRANLALIDGRIEAAQVRLLGGQCIIGDRMMMSAVGATVGKLHADYDDTEPKRAELIRRLGSELPGFANYRTNLEQNQNPYLRLPGSEGYQRLPGATQDQ